MSADAPQAPSRHAEEATAVLTPIEEPGHVPEKDRASGRRYREHDPEGRSPALRAWRERNREHVAAYQAQWKDANRDHVREYNREYMRVHSAMKRSDAARQERRRQYKREWYEQNRDRYQQQQKEGRARRRAADPDGFRKRETARTQRWRAKHRDELNATTRERRRDNPDAHREESRRYYASMREEILARKRSQYAADPELYRERARAYRARERRRREAGLPPRRLHTVRAPERRFNAHAADEFFAREYSVEQVRMMTAGPPTPSQLVAAWKRDCLRARAAHHAAATAERDREANLVAGPRLDSRRERERQRAEEEARLDAVGRRINERLRSGRQRLASTDPAAPHQSGSLGNQSHLHR